MEQKPTASVLEIENLQSKLTRINAMFEDRFTQIMKILDRKVDKDELMKIESSFNEQISSLTMSKFPDHGELMARLQLIENNVRFILLIKEIIVT